METSTPHRRKSFARKSLLNSSIILTPLRNAPGPSSPLNPAILLERNDDEAERSKRRSIVDMHRRLTNVSSVPSPLIEVNHLVDENQMKDHLKICTKLYSENKISTKNAWELHVIDIIRRISSTNTDNVLQVAGSSLEIGAKVYAIRVDDIHTKGLKLASSMAKSKEKEGENEETGETAPDGNETVDNQARKKSATKRRKKIGNKSTVDKEGKSLFAPPKLLEPVLFSTKENIDVGATDNLFTYKLLVNPANQLFMLLTGEKYWTTDDDVTMQMMEEVEIEIPKTEELSKTSLCPPFKDFEIGKWDAEEEAKQLGVASMTEDVVVDENGIPYPELDGSIHDIFENDNNEAPDSASEEEQQEHFQAQIHGEIAHVVDAIPEENRVQTDYGYNSYIKTDSGKFIDRIWAGPSHWKVKFIRRSTARFSGSTVAHVVKHTRKAKVPERINLSVKPKAYDPSLQKIVIKKAPPTVPVERITLPVPEISFHNFHKIIKELQTRPGVPKPTLNGVKRPCQDYEVPAYNYENQNDSQYCSQHSLDDMNAEPDHNSFEQEEAPVACGNFLDNDGLVHEPDMVSTDYVHYALQAKKMDMKKLKSVVWKRLTQSSGGDVNKSDIEQINFSQLYEDLPSLLPKDMNKELTVHLAFAALLHLCNENNLLLYRPANESLKDFAIKKAVM